MWPVKLNLQALSVLADASGNPGTESWVHVMTSSNTGWFRQETTKMAARGQSGIRKTA